MSSQRNKSSQLPPLPKLRPRPGLIRKDNNNEDEEMSSNEESGSLSTSRLLTKDECNGGKRGKGAHLTGSVHSIPKFSQVRPNTRLTAVQKVLQSRIMSKIAKKRQLEMQQEEAKRRKKEQENENEVDLRARNLLQNMILMKDNSNDGGNKSSNGNGMKRRGRKPAKEEICRVMPKYNHHLDDDDEEEEEEEQSPPPSINHSNQVILVSYLF